jgi:Tfp pilus assembly protein FimT
MSISLILAVAALPTYGNLYGATQLTETEAQIIQNLRLVREDSMVSLNNETYGVKFLTDQYVIYQGASYAARDSSSDRIYELDNALTITTTLTNDEINFSKNLGQPNVIGDITLIHSTQGVAVITINRLGAVAER